MRAKSRAEILNHHAGLELADHLPRLVEILRLATFHQPVRGDERGALQAKLAVNEDTTAQSTLLTDEIERGGDVLGYSAGGQVVTSGGRVLCVTALGDNIAAAQKDCYRAVDKISWEGMTLRRDIGWRAVARYSRSD